MKKKHGIKDPLPSSKEAAKEVLEVGNSGLDNKTPTHTHPSPESILQNNAPRTAGRLPHYSHNNKEEEGMETQEISDAQYLTVSAIPSENIRDLYNINFFESHKFPHIITIAGRKMKHCTMVVWGNLLRSTVS